MIGNNAKAVMLSFHFLQDQKVNYSLKKLIIGRIKEIGRLSKNQTFLFIFTVIMIRKSGIPVFGSPLICRINQNKSYFYLPFTSSAVFTGLRVENQLRKLKRDIMYAVTLLETKNIYVYHVA